MNNYEDSQNLLSMRITGSLLGKAHRPNPTCPGIGWLGLRWAPYILCQFFFNFHTVKFESWGGGMYSSMNCTQVVDLCDQHNWVTEAFQHPSNLLHAMELYAQPPRCKPLLNTSLFSATINFFPFESGITQYVTF